MLQNKLLVGLLLLALVVQAKAESLFLLKENTIVVMVDNWKNPNKKQMQGAWGLSMLVFTDGYIVLFDTGPDPETLEQNFTALDLKPTDVDIVVLSHDHRENVGGLPYIIEHNPKVTVYATHRMKTAVDWNKLRFNQVNKQALLTPNIHFIVTTGDGKPFSGKEGVLVIMTQKGNVVLSGSGHAGLDKIAQAAHQVDPERLYLLAGGLHLIHGELDVLGQQVVGRYTDIGKLEGDIERFVGKYKPQKIVPLFDTGELDVMAFKKRLGAFVYASKPALVIKIAPPKLNLAH